MYRMPKCSWRGTEGSWVVGGYCGRPAVVVYKYYDQSCHCDSVYRCNEHQADEDKEAAEWCRNVGIIEIKELKDH